MIASGIVTPAVCESADDRPLSVCDLMADLTAYKNRVVTVVGEYTSGLEQSSIGAPSCKQHFTTFEYEWPTALQLRLVGGPDTPPKVPFEADSANIESFYRAVRQLRAMTVQGCIEVTGMVQLKDDYSPTFMMPGGRRRGLGFGHMSALPAQLIIKSVRIRFLQPYKPGTECVCCSR